MLNMDIRTPLSRLENSLELLLNSLSRAFKLKPLTAAGLLTNNNEYLKQACQQGIKNFGYQPLFQWYYEILDNVEILAHLMLDEYTEFKSKHHFTEVLQTLSSGLLSSQPSIITLTYVILQRLL